MTAGRCQDCFSLGKGEQHDRNKSLKKRRITLHGASLGEQPIKSPLLAHKLAYY